MSAPCEHKDLVCSSMINRIPATDGGPMVFIAEISFSCADCKQPFHFSGVHQGFSFKRPLTSADGIELRAPIAPGPAPRYWIQTFEVPVDLHAALLEKVVEPPETGEPKP